MEFGLTEEQRLLQDSVIRFAQGTLNDRLAERDRDQTFPRELWKACAAIGLQGLPVPDEYGGTGADALTCAIALEALGYGCRDGGLVFSLCAHLLACVVPIWRHGSAEQKEQFLPGL
jgi:alkylation response protein AidB-like acyl-CoA dehydrogenase